MSETRYQVQVLPLLWKTGEEWMPHGKPFKSRRTAELVAQGVQGNTRIVEVPVDCKRDPKVPA